MTDSDTFQCLRVPADASEPLETLRLPKEGGLTNDALVAHARSYFLQRYAPTFSSASTVDAVGALDIMAVTVPTRGNGFLAVSLYRYGGDHSDGGDGFGAPPPLPANDRATALVRAAGHALPTPLRGDAFLGRAHDDEGADVWERRDFTEADADPRADWCRAARQTGGGGGSGSAAAASLSGILRQQGASGAGGPVQVVGGNGPVSEGFGMSGAPPVHEANYTWTQDGDEVELKFTVPTETAAKDCKISFTRNSLRISVAGADLLQGTTFLPLVADECTYTMAREAGADCKELAVTLMKEEPGKTWTFVVQ